MIYPKNLILSNTNPLKTYGEHRWPLRVCGSYSTSDTRPATAKRHEPFLAIIVHKSTEMTLIKQTE